MRNLGSYEAIVVAQCSTLLAAQTKNPGFDYWLFSILPYTIQQLHACEARRSNEFRATYTANLTTEGLPWLQTSWRDVVIGRYERLIA